MVSITDVVTNRPLSIPMVRKNGGKTESDTAPEDQRSSMYMATTGTISGVCNITWKDPPGTASNMVVPKYYIMGTKYPTIEEFSRARASFLDMKGESESEKKIE